MKKFLIPLVLSIVIISALYYLTSTETGFEFGISNKSELKRTVIKDSGKNFEFTMKTEPVDLIGKRPGEFYNSKNSYPRITPLTFETDAWVTEITPIMEGGPPEVLHHGTIKFKNVEDEQCPQNNKIFYTTSKEMVGGKTSQGFGYFMPKGTTLFGLGNDMHLRNDTEENYKNVSYKVSIKGTTNPSLIHTSLEAFQLNLECYGNEGFIFPVPSEKNFSISLGEKYIAKENFKMHMLVAHIHDYGTKLEFLVNGKVTLTFEPILNDKVIITIPLYYPEKPIEIKKGDILDIVAYYDNNSGEIVEGMGIFGGLVEKEN